jgi:UDP-N-acetyl-D-mannosaminuronic acid dehydrogenase
MAEDTLVIVRSTVPIGTCRGLVLPLLRPRVSEPLLAVCPERTIQGKALEELRNLPQIVGGLNETATGRAKALFEAITSQVIAVSSLEAAEAVKLICNAHTDLIYGFGNEVALTADAWGLDAYELIDAANLNYPRPDLSKPGFVGGSCLSKDPYLLIHSAQAHGYFPSMVAAARHLNESVPGYVGQRVLDALRELGREPARAKILVSGFAYKGQPETDDLRGSPIGPVLDLLRDQAGALVGHDFVVSAGRIAAMGVEPVGLEAGFADADAALILNNHINYRARNIHELIARMRRPAVLFDVWGVFLDQLRLPEHGLRYMRLGHG